MTRRFGFLRKKTYLCATILKHKKNKGLKYDMKPLKTYIDYLIMTRHYANVPGWGAYILTESQATAVRGINAPRMTVTFSNAKRKDDGILAGIIMEMEGIGYDDALRYINSELHTLKVEDQQIVNTGSMVGLTNLEIKPWKELPRTVTLTLPGMWLRKVAVIAIILIAFCMGSNTMMQTEQETYASIFDTHVLGGVFAKEAHNGHVAIATPAITDQSTSKEITIGTEVTLESPAIETVATENAEPVQYLEGKQYFMIIGSLSSREDAEKQQQIMSKRGIGEMGILVRGGKYRLYIQTASTFDEAKTLLKQLRNIPELSKVWINPATVKASECLKPLNSSLLTNKKNKYNDNQVSVELSHLNTRTGRDKG